MSTVNILILLGVWTLVSIPVALVVGRVFRNRREVDVKDFDNWTRRAQWAEPIGAAQCSCREDHDDNR